ncbi:hypothetical protein BV898_08907 [Hypsibius exemplaris]|uniref:Uncharacterized protein n=1 Tax=Hypsibius exemplaris TaxID=2072580 RepID=A0A1W0WPB0_HYPEX|nr:hypothetical protein BV898_08907 [Hypsibius exemplaris]
MTTGLFGLLQLLFLTLTVIWTLFILYELREAFSDPVTKTNARKRLIEDLQHFSQTSKNLYGQAKNAMQLLATTYKLHLHVFLNTAITFVRDLTRTNHISELIGWPDDSDL